MNAASHDETQDAQAGKPKAPNPLRHGLVEEKT
jgi:hypothetical protein